MDHDELRKKLPEYLEGELNPEEKALMDRHLRSCEACRAELGELEKTVAWIRDLGDVEPPPWLSLKVMARIKEEAWRKKGVAGWLRRSRRWLPLEAAALVVISITGYMVYRAVSPEVGQVVTLDRESGVKQAEAPESPATEPQKTQQDNGEAKSANRAAPDRKHTPLPSAPSREPDFSSKPDGDGALSSDQENVAESKVAGESPAGAASPKGEVGISAAPPVMREKAAPAPARRLKSLGDGETAVVRMVLAAADRRLAVEAVLAEARRIGGEAETLNSGAGDVIVRIDRRSLKEFIDRLAKVGELRNRPALDFQVEGRSRVVIAVEGVTARDR
jgi:hypothetical protein